MASVSRKITASVARVEMDAASRATYPVTAFVLLAYLFSGLGRSDTVGITSLMICIAGYAIRRIWRHLLERKKLVEIGAEGISVEGKLRLRYEQVVGVLPLSADGRSTIRVGTQHGGLLIGLPTEDATTATDVALAIEAGANLRVRTFYLRYRFAWGAVLSLLGFGIAFATAWREGPGGIAVGGFAMALAGVLLASVGPRARVRVGRDGVEISLFGLRLAMLRASDGLRVEAEQGRVRLIAGTRTVVFHVPGYEAGMVADEIRAALRSEGADARLAVPPLAQGSARSWLDAVRRRAHAGDYRGRVETIEDLRAAIADGARKPTERIYAALRLSALGEGDALLQTARDTTVLPRLRVSLEAELGGDDDALVNELEALAVEEATSPPARRGHA